ncbi:MAG: peptidoglycan glycosyltransferase, partial [Bacteroidetes bacterium]|nr:peptidoglycan glycosyltransferase [Bacteroidota bacterium]
VNEPGGTARLARIPGITVCGKTGTAQNPHGKDHAVFIAFAPMEDPKIAIAVYVENSGAGGKWAAPIASLCMEQFLTDSISRPDLEKRMEETNLIADEGNFVKFVSKRKRR